MISGKYKISMKMPNSTETGTVTFIESNGTISGKLIAGDIISTFSNGRTDGSKFEFSGVIRKLFFKINYIARGEVQGDRLTATAETKHGDFIINGDRI